MSFTTASGFKKSLSSSFLYLFPRTAFLAAAVDGVGVPPEAPDWFMTGYCFLAAEIILN